jgi:hypothetical protein
LFAIQRRLKEAANQSAAVQAAKAIKISGATGRNAGIVNGLFELTTQTVNGAPVWQMPGAKPRCFPLSYSGSAA